MDLTGHPARCHHEHPIGDGEDLVEVVGHEQHSAATVAHRKQLLEDEAGCGDVQPTAGVHGDHQVRLVCQLAGEHRFLLVPPDNSPARWPGPDDLTSNRASDSAHSARALAVQQAAPNQAALLPAAEVDVLPQRQSQGEPVEMPVLGNPGHMHGAVVRPAAGPVLEPYFASVGTAHPGDHLDDLPLAVPIDAGHTNDLAGPHLEVDVGDRTAVAGDGHPETLRSGFPGTTDNRSNPSSTRWPTISGINSRGLVAATSSVATSLPRRMTVTRSQTEKTSSSLWVMKITLSPDARYCRNASKSTSRSWGSAWWSARRAPAV